MMFENCGLDDNIKRKLSSLFYDGKRPHALLIDGGTASQRDELSRIIASAFVCSQTGDAPCGNCRSCKKAKDGIHPDIITVTRPDDKKFFTKDSIKKITEEAYYTPNEADTRVFILSEVQFITEESQNVLLKILEEPPSYTAFILTAQSGNSVIGTVLSRVTRIRLGAGDSEEYDEHTLSVIKSLSAALLSPYEFDIIEALSPIDGNKQLTASVLSLTALFLRDAVVQKNGGAPQITSLAAESEKVSAAFKTEKLLLMYSAVNSFSASLDGNPNYTLLSALLCAALKEPENENLYK